MGLPRKPVVLRQEERQVSYHCRVAVRPYGRTIGAARLPCLRCEPSTKARQPSYLSQVEDIYNVSNKMAGLEFKRSPWPGRIESRTGVIEIQAADKWTGHASGFDLVVCDETGLFRESDRRMLAGLTSSTSARNGRIIHLSIRGESPFIPELIADELCYSVVYESPDDCDLDDKAAWEAANPGLAEGIKSYAYMERESAKAIANNKKEPFFRAYDLNQNALREDSEPLLTTSELTKLFTRQPLAAEGEYVLGVDAGATRAWSSAVALWPATGRVAAFCLAPGIPGLKEQAERDQQPADDYERLARLGVLMQDAAVHMPRLSVLAEGVLSRWGKPEVICCDNYRDAEVAASFPGIQVVPRSSGGADAETNIQAIRQWALDAAGSVEPASAELMRLAFGESTIKRSGEGNVRIGKLRGRNESRDDAVQALALAIGYCLREELRNAVTPESVSNDMVALSTLRW